MKTDESRNRYLNADDEQLSAECRFTAYKSTGRGGQKKNKTASAVRLEHIPSGLVVTASKHRSQHDNRKTALKKLRMLIALEIRSENHISPAPKTDMSVNNSDYFLWVAWVLDCLFESDF